MIAIGHDRRARSGKDHIRGFGSDTVARRVLDGIAWQSGQVSDICEQIEADNKERPERERKRNVAPRFFTSPAVKVILFHASAEKSELVCATQMPTKRPKAVAAVKPAPTSCKVPRKVQKSLKFAAPAPDLRPTMIPRMIRRDERAGLGGGENVLHELAKL